jgi:hypothetical protein
MISMSDSPVEEAHARVVQDVYGDRSLETVREITQKAPLACLAVAFVLGIMMARRR